MMFLSIYDEFTPEVEPAWRAMGVKVVMCTIRMGTEEEYAISLSNLRYAAQQGYWIIPNVWDIFLYEFLRPRPDMKVRFDRFWQDVEPFRHVIVAFIYTDEPFWVATQDGYKTDKTKVANTLIGINQVLRQKRPVMVNHAEPELRPRTEASLVTDIGFDVVGFDVYAGSHIQPAEYEALIARLQRLYPFNQAIFLVPDGMVSVGYTEADVVWRLTLIFEIAKRNGIRALIPFPWHNGFGFKLGLKDSPMLQAVYTEMFRTARELTREARQSFSESQMRQGAFWK